MASATTEILRVASNAFYRSSLQVKRQSSYLGEIHWHTSILPCISTSFISQLLKALATFIQGLSQFQNQLGLYPSFGLGLLSITYSTELLLAGHRVCSFISVVHCSMYYLAIVLNKRFGLYEPPAITVQKTGTVYAPKTGFLGKFGFSSVEAAINPQRH